MEPSDCPGCRLRDLRIAELEARVLALEGIIRDLLDRLGPPKPPRAQDPQPPAPDKKPTGRKPGGQPGHPPHLKTLLPLERVANVIPFVPSQCGRCRAALPQQAGPLDPPPVRHQVAELPPVVAVVTEYQGHSRTCPCCGEITHARFPPRSVLTASARRSPPLSRTSPAATASANAASKKSPTNSSTLRSLWERSRTWNRKPAPLWP